MFIKGLQRLSIYLCIFVVHFCQVLSCKGVLRAGTPCQKWVAARPAVALCKSSLVLPVCSRTLAMLGSESLRDGKHASTVMSDFVEERVYVQDGCAYWCGRFIFIGKASGTYRHPAQEHVFICK